MHRGVTRIILIATSALIIACGRSPTQPTPPTPPACSYAINPATVTFDSAGGTGTVNVETGASCGWSITADGSWVHITSAPSGSGPAAVAFRVDSNDAADGRSSTFRVSTASATIQQVGRTTTCTYTLDPSSRTTDADGGSSSFDVRTGAGCTWRADSRVSWLEVRTPAGDATGPGRVELGVDRNTSPDERTGTVAVRSALFTLTQRGATVAQCTYSVSPTSVDLHWHGVSGDWQNLTIATGASCSWSGSVDVDWLRLRDGGSRSGPGTLGFSTTEFTQEATRTAPVMVRWPTESAGQNVWVTQSGCRYGVGPSAVDVAAAGGRAALTVVTQSIAESCAIPCPWTAQAKVAWIQIVGSLPRAGDDRLSFDVDANAGAARTGTLVVAGRIVTVNQAAP